ncbi:chitin deacetylase [Irineochytrium annulatum]|nr:chitin deacetylase [Irineochytrium annulatum]
MKCNSTSSMIESQRQPRRGDGVQRGFVPPFKVAKTKPEHQPAGDRKILVPSKPAWEPSSALTPLTNHPRMSLPSATTSAAPTVTPAAISTTQNPCLANNIYPECNTTFIDPVLDKRIPDPPPVALWTKAMNVMASARTDLSSALSMSPRLARVPGGSGIDWGSTTTFGAYDPTNANVEMCSCTAGKWAITYDDGPLQFEDQFLAMLAEKNVKATFFVIGANVPWYSKQLLNAYNAGHQIGLHTWTHSFASTKTTDQIVAETIYNAIAVYNVIGKVPRYWRPPRGDIDDRVRAIMSAFGLRVAMWNVDSNDWEIGTTTVWTAVNSTIVLDSIFQYGYMNYVSSVDGLHTLAWVPPAIDPNNPNNNAYQGFISLEHELSLVNLDVAKAYIDKIFTQQYTHFNDPANPASKMFTSALAYECDLATNKGPYLNEDEPFHKLVKYWAGSLPLTGDQQKVTEGVFDFISADGAPGTPSKPTGDGTARAGGSGTAAAGGAPGQTVSVTSISTRKNAGARVKAGGVALALKI